MNAHDDYFNEVIRSLTIDDFSVLSILYDREATAAFKAITNADVLKSSGLSEATYRRIIYRLEVSKFIEIISVKRQSAIYITNYGVVAIEKSIQGVGA